MDFTTAEAAADRLIEHRRASARAGTPVTHTLRPAAEVLSAALAPTNAADAYAIQDALIRRLGPVADAALPALSVPAAVQQTLYLIYKESLHNIVKYARGTTTITASLRH